LRRVERYLASRIDGHPTLFNDVHPPSQPPTGDLLGKTQADAAEAVLRTAGKPMNTGDIVQAMVARGYPERDDRKHLENSVFSAMRRAPDRFKKVARGTWALVNAGGGSGTK
jgi:hypothetical protein